MPYDKRLSRKKKFQPKEGAKAKEGVVLNSARINDRREETEQYMRLCRGEELRPAAVTSRLTCRYESRGKPYYVYGPRKLETVSLRPHIVLLHEFITGSECDGLVGAASPKLRRSQMVGSKANGTLDDRRVSEQAWLHEDDSADAESVSRRMDDFLDLETRSTNHSELFQVANYGLAGQYSCHYDQGSNSIRFFYHLTLGLGTQTLRVMPIQIPDSEAKFVVKKVPIESAPRRC